MSGGRQLTIVRAQYVWCWQRPTLANAMPHYAWLYWCDYWVFGVAEDIPAAPLFLFVYYIIGDCVCVVPETLTRAPLNSNEMRSLRFHSNSTSPLALAHTHTCIRIAVSFQAIWVRWVCVRACAPCIRIGCSAYGQRRNTIHPIHVHILFMRRTGNIRW